MQWSVGCCCCCNVTLGRGCGGCLVGSAEEGAKQEHPHHTPRVTVRASLGDIRHIKRASFQLLNTFYSHQQAATPLPRHWPLAPFGKLFPHLSCRHAGAAQRHPMLHPAPSRRCQAGCCRCVLVKSKPTVEPQTVAMRCHAMHPSRLLNRRSDPQHTPARRAGGGRLLSELLHCGACPMFLNPVRQEGCAHVCSTGAATASAR